MNPAIIIAGPFIVVRLYSTKVLNYVIVAGLLTCSIFKQPSHSTIGTMALVTLKTFTRTYSSGSVQDLHLIPF